MEINTWLSGIETDYEYLKTLTGHYFKPVV